MHENTLPTFDGCTGRLACRAWHPAGQPRGLLVLAHGYAEHIGRYAHVAESFTARGYAVYGYDMIGHGLSEGRRGHVARFADYVEDLRRFVAIAQNRDPERSTFIVGHSQGGLIALAYGETNPVGLSGMVISAPGLELAMPVPGWKLALSKVLSRIAPTFSMANGIPAEYLTRDHSIASAYAVTDPLIVKVASARWAAEFAQAQSDTLAGANRFRLPVLLMHGSADRLINPDSTRRFYAAAASEDKTLKIYDGFYHELFNELGKEQVFADMESWLERHLPA
jgi:alpha-beta hydrolase superfamily lysophospholipase